MKKILIAIIAFLIFDSMKTIIWKYAFDNSGDTIIVILICLLSISLSVILAIILSKLFSKKR